MIKRKSGKWIFFSLGFLLVSFAGISGFTSPNMPIIPAGKDSAVIDSPADEAMEIFSAGCLGEAGLKEETFRSALAGFEKLAEKGIISKPILTIVDLSQSSDKKRLYVIDLIRHTLLKNTLVAHGRNSGDKMATHFSNNPSSLQSSLGFFVTKSTYMGSNGYSLKLDGLEKGINDKAMERAIVMHGAGYVNEAMAEQTGRIGRSWGCPAVSVKEHREIIDLIKNGSCIFINGGQKKYTAQSMIINNPGGNNRPA